MNFDDLMRHWDKFGKEDPLWGILSEKDKKGGGWNLDEFFETGRKEIERLMGHVHSVKGGLSFQSALDFGCGVGRLTQPLCSYFHEVHGVDIASSMIELARGYNRHGPRCQYHLNATNDLSLFENDRFDLIYSNITLQHMKPKYSRRYIQEFVRILKPGGLLLFQLPHAPNYATLKGFIIGVSPSSVFNAFLRIKHRNKPIMEMYGIRRQGVARLIASCNARIIDIQQNDNAGQYWNSFQYGITK